MKKVLKAYFNNGADQLLITTPDNGSKFNFQPPDTSERPSIL